MTFCAWISLRLPSPPYLFSKVSPTSYNQLALNWSYTINYWVLEKHFPLNLPPGCTRVFFVKCNSRQLYVHIIWLNWARQMAPTADIIKGGKCKPETRLLEIPPAVLSCLYRTSSLCVLMVPIKWPDWILSATGADSLLNCSTIIHNYEFTHHNKKCACVCTFARYV